jgi:hypothetical protein
MYYQWLLDVLNCLMYHTAAGLIDDTIYDEDCYFADPTVAFRGRRCEL